MVKLSSESAEFTIWEDDTVNSKYTAVTNGFHVSNEEFQSSTVMVTEGRLEYTRFLITKHVLEYFGNFVTFPSLYKQQKVCCVISRVLSE